MPLSQSPACLSAADFRLTTAEADAHALARIRDAAFDAVMALWRKRRGEGMTQEDLVRILGRDAAWVSKALRDPAGWDFGTLASLMRALSGEVEIAVLGLDEPLAVAEDQRSDNGQPRSLPRPR